VSILKGTAETQNVGLQIFYERTFFTPEKPELVENFWPIFFGIFRKKWSKKIRFCTMRNPGCGRRAGGNFRRGDPIVELGPRRAPMAILKGKL